MSNFPLEDAAEHLAKQGRYGDSMLVHMNPIEVDAISKLSPTGKLTTNPQTGQPEAFLPLLFSLAAPSVLGAMGATAMSPLVASALGTGLGTVAEGGSLKEGISAGLMGGLTGGLLQNVMPAAGTELTKGIPATGTTPAVPPTSAALPDTSTIANLQTATSPSAGAIAGGAAEQGLFGNLASNIGLQQGATPDMLTGATPTGLTRGQAFKSFGIPAAASGLVGEMYVPMDMQGMPEEESPYQYEGPYMPTEQRTMTGPVDPLASAFGGEQIMLEGNVLPPGFNMRYGGLIKRLEKGGMPKAQQQIEESADTLERRAQDERIREYQRSIMAAPTVDPRIQETWQGIPIPTAGIESMQGDPNSWQGMPIPSSPPQAPSPYQAPSLREIYDSQGKLLDDVLGPNPDAPLSGSYPNYQRLKEINRNYNPIVHGIHGVSALFGKGIAEAMEAVDEARARRKEKE